MHIGSLRRLLFALVVWCMSAASFAQIGVGVVVAFAPPPLPVYEQPLCPGEGYTGNQKLDQKYQQQQDKQFAKQEQERQKLQQKQEQEHQRLAQQKANEARMQQVEQRHQQQTQQLQQKHDQQRQQLQQKQQPATRSKPPK